MTIETSRPKNALDAVADALAARRCEWEAEAHRAVALALAESGRDASVAWLIAGAARAD